MTKEEFKNSKLIYDKEGLWMIDPVKRKQNGDVLIHPIMFNDEKSVMEKTIEVLYDKIKFKRVLEIGFGLGISATIFQQYDLQKHVIVEPHNKIVRNAISWSRDKQNVIVIHDFIQDQFGNLKNEEFDLIFDDRYEAITPNEEINWEGFNSKAVVRFWGTIEYRNQDLNKGFIFDVDGTTYYQNLVWLK